ncbi:hypothetical protein D3C75_1171770 [compost metagenome]
MLAGVFIGLIDCLGSIGIAQPVGYGGHVIQAFAGGDGGHGAAIGVAANHYILYA